MNGNQQIEMHYSNTGFPYTTPDGFVIFFDGCPHVHLPHVHLPHVHLHYPHPPPMHHQEPAFWPMNMNSYRIGLPVPECTSHYHPYVINDELARMDLNRRVWEYPSVMNVEETTTVAMPYEENTISSMQPIPEQMSTPTGTVSPQYDADSQELLDLRETVGTENRGLSQEAIALLPKSKFKAGGIFSRKKSSERCVICQARYKRGDRQIHLPCKHVYHAHCGSKWLSINKTCPVCNREVLID